MPIRKLGASMTLPARFLRWTGLALILSCAGCADDPEPSQPADPNSGQPANVALEVEIPVPGRKVRGPFTLEALSEAVGEGLAGFGDKIFVRDFDGAAAFFTPGFLGHDLFAPASGIVENLPLDARRIDVDLAKVRTLRRGPWVEQLAKRAGPWQRVDLSHWRVLEAEFERGRGQEPITWGRLVLKGHVVGIASSGARVSLERTCAVIARRSNKAAPWLVDRLQILGGFDLYRTQPGFIDVSRSSGVAHEGIRYGQPGNDSDGWNGVAVGDVDGDGRWDIFVPGSTRNFLYRAVGDGTFVEEAEERGLLGQGGGTGALFLDYDRDGDSDLIVAHVGWGKQEGRTPRAWRNDGSGRFTDVTQDLGLAGIRHATYSMAAFDADGDGWTDLFLCGYGVMGIERNDSWREATNGEPDILLRNDPGVGFVDVTAKSGIQDHSWGYSAAAADIDRDGDQDLVVANTFGTSQVWRNKGDGSFESAGKAMGMERRGMSVGVRFGDLDADGLLDVFLTGSHSPTAVRMFERYSGTDKRQLDEIAGLKDGNVLYRGRPDGSLERVDHALGASHSGWAWGSALVDLDQDGLTDVVCANGFVTGDLAADT
tara:strand:- start:5084 stop:6877 length:1794 start_codon:yes stop_codon:yes gene_type:complete